MDAAAYDELIPVWIFRELIDEEIINEQLYEAGFDPELYENPERLYAEIIEPMVAEIVAEVGYDAAHFVENRTFEYNRALARQEDIFLTDFAFDFAFEPEADSSREEVWAAAVELNSDIAEDEYKREIIGYDVSIAEWHIHQVMDEYMMERRDILYETYTADNEAFIESYIGDYVGDRERILYSGYFTATVIAELTATEIKTIAQNDGVDRIELYEEIFGGEDEVDDVATHQIGVTGANGTRDQGLRGSGLRIGMIEGGIADITAPQLRGMAGSRFAIVTNIGENGANVSVSVSDHATKVASILVGQRVSINRRAFEGIVPSVQRLYMAGVASGATQELRLDNVMRAVQEMARRNVHVVNISWGVDRGGYTAQEREIDRTILTSRMVVVKSAGNNAGGSNTGTNNVTAPGNAMNLITVGNAQTLRATNPSTNNLLTTRLDPPFAMRFSSSFLSPNFLPNKPDITAPGTDISTVGSNGVIRTDSGTSFAAPLVAGVAVQMIQVMWNDGFIARSTDIKAVLAASADTNAMSTTNNPLVGNQIRERSGVGFLDAREAVRLMRQSSNNLTNRGLVGGIVDEHTISFPVGAGGSRVRIAMVFDQNPRNSITNTDHLMNLDIRLRCLRQNTIIASSISPRHNIEIIHRNNLPAGQYRLYVTMTSSGAASRGSNFSVFIRRW